MVAEMAIIGKVIAPFGIEGAVKVYPYSDFLDRYRLLKRVELEDKGFSRFKDIKKARRHKNLWVFYFEDCSTRDEAQDLVGSLVKIPAVQRVPLPPGSYYLDELLGLEAREAGGKKLGYMRDILRTGSNDVYVISEEKEQGQAGSRREILVPALKSVVKEINREKGYILLELPAGLLE
ncbi:MAG: 16S rRNA processing protein RimM [Firmicutes bacterium]|nr:16S rRNA processing protein RimM [Bacillota bacterium]